MLLKTFTTLVKIKLHRTVNNTRLSTVISLYMVTATSAVTLLLLAELRERDSLTPVSKS